MVQLDPVEHAVLLIGLYELGQRPDVPFRVVINEGVAPLKQVIGPREFALLMIAIGLFALVVATVEDVQYRKTMRKLRPEARYSHSSLVSAMISILGLLAMASVIFRW